MRPKPRQDLGRPLRRPGNRERRRKVVEGPLRLGHVSRRTQLLERVAVPQGRDERHRPPAVRDLNGLAPFGEPKYATRVLTKVADSDGLHVLPVAHRAERSTVSLRRDVRVLYLGRRACGGAHSHRRHPALSPNSIVRPSGRIGFAGGERHVRAVSGEFVEQYHSERNHQGLGNVIPFPCAVTSPDGCVCRRDGLGALLKGLRTKSCVGPVDHPWDTTRSTVSLLATGSSYLRGHPCRSARWGRVTCFATHVA